jgi:uncharacterized protein involved in type VI secretion and phage assembly
MGLPVPVDGQGPRFFGVYPALVTKMYDDPDRLGRVQVKFPSLGTDGANDVRAWATLCSPYADKDQGLQVRPEEGSQVVVAFEAGDFRRPYIIGAAWNGTTPLPDEPKAANDIRVLRTRADSRLEFDDAAGAAKVSITMASGHKVVLDDVAQEVTISHGNGCTIRLTPTAVEITANAQVNVTAPLVNVDAPTSTFTGIVNCQTLIASAGVISPAYTPGVGNLW